MLLFNISNTLNDDAKLQKVDSIALLSTPQSISEVEVDSLEELSYLQLDWSESSLYHHLPSLLVRLQLPSSVLDLRNLGV